MTLYIYYPDPIQYHTYRIYFLQSGKSTVISGLVFYIYIFTWVKRYVIESDLTIFMLLWRGKDL